MAHRVFGAYKSDDETSNGNEISSWADKDEAEEKKLKSAESEYELIILSQLENEDDINVMMIKKIVNRFGSLVEKFNITEPNYKLNVVSQTNHTYATNVDMIIRECFRDPVILDSLISAIRKFKKDVRGIKNPYFELYIKSNVVEKSRILRKTYLNAVSSGVTKAPDKTLEVYRSLMIDDQDVIIQLVQRFKDVDQVEYNYWVAKLCSMLSNK